jgi:hypothetical protein
MNKEISNKSLSNLKNNTIGTTPNHMLFYESPNSRISRRIKSGKTNKNIGQSIDSINIKRYSKNK